MENHVEIKVEPFWCGLPAPGDESMEFLPEVAIKTEVKVEGLDQLAHSSYSAAINLVHSTPKSEGERTWETVKTEARFGFVDVDDGATTAEPGLAQDVDDPLGVTPQTRGDKQAILDGMKRAMLGGLEWEPPDSRQPATGPVPSPTVGLLGSVEDRESDVNVDKGVEGGDKVRHRLASYPGDKPHPCVVCGRRFSKASNLRKHAATHGGTRRFGCDLCPSRFHQRSDAASHRRSHTGERPYGCELCEARFSQSSGLAKHRRSHTDERPFECDHCKARFKQRDGLVTHIRRHLGRRLAFQCAACRLAFASRQDLMVHRIEQRRRNLCA